MEDSLQSSKYHASTEKQGVYAPMVLLLPYNLSRMTIHVSHVCPGGPEK
jgi:hypothetical protein